MRNLKAAACVCGALTVALGAGACGGSGDSDDGGQAAATTGSTGGCTPKHPGLKTVHSGQLTVALYEAPPFATVKGGKLAGAEGDIIARIAALECLKPTPLMGSAAAAIPAITSGRADTAIGSWYRTAERAKVIALGAPVMKDQMAIVSKDGAIGTIPDLKGKKVGAVIGYLWVDDLKKLLGSSLKLYPSGDAMYRDLASGRLDALIDGVSGIKPQLGKTPVAGAAYKVPPADASVAASQQPGQPQFGVKKDNPALRQALDEDRAALQADHETEKLIVQNGFPAELADPGPPNEL
jgi:polar amino acid transport system substrate-binding protein